RDTAEEGNLLESSSSSHRDDAVGSTSSEKEVTTPGVVNDMEITLFDLPVSERTNDPTNSSSPDIFEDKSKDDSATVSKSADRGPRRRSSRLSSSRLSMENRLSASSRHNTASLREEEKSQALSKVSEASKVPIINLSDNNSKDVVDPEVVDHVDMAEQEGKSTPTDPYKNEYCNYYDSFVEHWYEPAIESTTNQGNHEDGVPQESCKEGGQQSETKTPTPKSASDSTRSFISSPLEQVVVSENRHDVEQFPTAVFSQDSFFDTPKFITDSKPDVEKRDSFAENNHPGDLAEPAAHSTPLQPARKKARFGSNVKILKTTNITPMPDYDSMNDECLKNELRKFGLKPMGRKRSIAILKKIYAEIHPEIDPSTPTLRPLIVDAVNEDAEHAPKMRSLKASGEGAGY
ncbi:hypothetical protein KIN20_033663, partial [Parelaphostrongylus tenuis]